ncbi:hypothetical protein H2200_011913 [Cladophialophora chaetospira]|uniref:Uncharacterized protein n=1 Tax=Cladophialophora chaetospira TaxID=386627 RepID=A0AA39CD18_9EURO|nr:hypothetical protein H2200_011913 [Cladophialophora chaetospira]
MADSKSRPSSPLLPAFGIRDLNEPPSSLGVVQISRRQYASTIQSQPDATLSYVDLDDGEVITVGSSLELSQRLDEPVTHAAYNGRSPVAAWPAYTNALEEKENKMHIFDIRRTSGSLAVWRDHEAYSSKSLRTQESSSPSLASRSISPNAAASPSSSRQEDDLTTGLSKLRIACEPAVLDTASEPAAPQSDQDATSAQVDKALNDVFTGLQSHLGPLADFLESTANGLRKMAEKTRETDTTPVENVLNGFKTIVTEVGALGLEFLATLDEELEKSRNNKDSETTSEPETQPLPPAPTSKPSSDIKTQPATESSPKKVTFIDLTDSPNLPLTKLKPTSFEALKRVGYMQELEKVVPPPFPICGARAPVTPFGTAPRTDFTVGPPPTFAKPSLMNTFAQATRHDNAKGSIIDSQPSDSDILVRYPPLPSLRKAASVSGLKVNPEQLSRYQPGMSTTSALSRYPSIGQFEHQARLKSRNDSDSKPRDVATSDLDWSFPPRQPKKTDIYKKPTVEDEEEVSIKPSVAFAAKSRDTLAEIKHYLANVEDETAKARDDFKKRPATMSYAPPLGGWSEPRMEGWYPTVSNSEATSAKPTAAAPPPPKAATQDKVQTTLSSRLSSPLSETYSRGPISPKKSQTVSGTNPAARLNGPFDPLAHIPVLQPRPQRSQPDLSAPKVASSSTTTEVPPPLTAGAFPRRNHTVHHTDRYKPRDLAAHPYSRPTLWDNFVKNNNSTSTVPLPSSTGRPWSYYPESSRPFDGSGFRAPAHNATRPPTFTSLRPVQSMGGLRQEASNSSQPFVSRTGPPAPTRQYFPAPAPPEPVTINTVTVPSPKPVSAPMPAPAPVAPRPAFGSISPLSSIQPLNAPPSGRVSRSSSILSPCPPAFTQPRGRSGTSPPAPFASKSVDECVKQLKAMGFGSDPNELARLSVYAGAAAGDVEAAIEMIEEDREAARELDSHASQVGSVRDVEKDFDDSENPWWDN